MDLNKIQRADDERVDGRAKVTGAAKYAAEHTLPGLCYGHLVASTIAKGSIESIDSSEAARVPGVLGIFSHANSYAVPGFQPAGEAEKTNKRPWNGLKVFFDNKIVSDGQPIVLVVADTPERAIHAAGLVKLTYKKEPHQTDFLKNLGSAKSPRSDGGPMTYTRGEANAWQKAPVQVNASYTLPMETHNPMEPHAIIAHWPAADEVLVYTKTQGPRDSVGAIAQAFQLDAKKVKVIAEYVGGGFGSALRTWPHEIAALIAAKMLNRPVKLVLTRPQMFSMVGYRPLAWQRVQLGAEKDGRLTAITHEAIGSTSSYETFTEGIVNASRFLYECPNVNTDYKILPLDLNTPIWMRGPGEATGCFALESALDELSYQLQMDPIALRLKNYAERDPERNLPWSSKYLKECYELGAEKIGWSARASEPKAKNENGWWVGYGMASGVFSAMRWQASVRAILKKDGTLILQSAVSDMGPGTATAMVKIASETLSYPAEKIRFELGDSSLPAGPTQGGSATTSTLGSAVFDVCTDIKDKLGKMASDQWHDYLQHAKPEELIFENGQIAAKNDSGKKINYTDLLERNRMTELVVEKSSAGNAELRKYSCYSFSVHFVKLKVHSRTGVVKIDRIVTTGDAGKIVSPKTAESQMIGGAVGGLGMALMEETLIDHRYGRYVNNNFADYHVPVHADTAPIDVIFVDKPDPILNPMGAKGMGEIALIGFAAAVANAVYHATGVRVRDLPITPDKVLMEL